MAFSRSRIAYGRYARAQSICTRIKDVNDKFVNVAGYWWDNPALVYPDLHGLEMQYELPGDHGSPMSPNAKLLRWKARSARARWFMARARRMSRKVQHKLLIAYRRVNSAYRRAWWKHRRSASYKQHHLN